MTDHTDIVERLSASARGYDEWRVQDDEGNYTIAFSWPEYVNPEREAQDWLAANQKYRAGYVVAKVHVLTLKEQRLLEAAAEITRLRAEVDARAESWNALQRAMADNARLRAEAEALRKDSERRHQLLILQHAESVELWNALKDLSFECDGVTRTEAPSRDTYNKTFAVLQRKLHLSPEALRGYAESGQSQTLDATKGTT